LLNVGDVPTRLWGISSRSRSE